MYWLLRSDAITFNEIRWALIDDFCGGKEFNKYKDFIKNCK